MTYLPTVEFIETSDIVSTTTINTYQNKLTLTFTPPIAGDYKIFVYAEYANEESKYIAVRLYDSTDAAIVAETIVTVDVIGTAPNEQYHHFSLPGKKRTLTTASRTFILQWHGESSAKIAYIRNAEIRVVKIDQSI